MIVPTCRRNPLLALCLNTLSPTRQTLPKSEYEVIVSDDGPAQEAQDLVEKNFPWVRWVAGPRRGPASNRNRGAREATGEWLAFIDDDCQADAQWLQAISKSIQEQAVQVIEGKTVCPGKRDDPFEEHVENLCGGVLWSCNLAIRRDLFADFKGFDEDFLEAGGEDMELAWRIQHSSARSLFVPEALVVHPPRRIGWRQLWWRTLLLRWILLYRLKTGQSPGLDTGWFVVAAHLIGHRLADLMRATRALVRQWEWSGWKRRLFYYAWKWVTFPVVLPYLLYWEFRFRRSVRGAGL